MITTKKPVQKVWQHPHQRRPNDKSVPGGGEEKTPLVRCPDWMVEKGLIRVRPSLLTFHQRQAPAGDVGHYDCGQWPSRLTGLAGH